jgi:hypothetical protein
MSIDDTFNCPARITLDAKQAAFLDELATQAPSLQSELNCELERGHPGSHAALGQHADDCMWWVHWTLSASEINPYKWCSAQHPDGKVEDDNACVLYDGHPGRHSSAQLYWDEDRAA